MLHKEELHMLGRMMWILILILLVLAYISMAMRLWVRIRIVKSTGWDDATMVLTLLLFTCYCIFIMVITLRASKATPLHHGNVRVTLIYVQLSEVFYILATTTLKISLGLFFLRILIQPWQRVLFHVILGVSAFYGLFYVLSTIFACGDPSKIADVRIGSEQCLSASFILTTGYIYGAINVIADWTFVLIPICILIDSSLDRRSKISVSILMAFGAIGSVGSIMRMVYLKGLLLHAHGMTATTVKATIWATAEPGTGIIAGSIALLRPLIRNITTTATAYVQSRKGSKASAMEEDNIALTLQGTTTKAGVYAIDRDDAWSPTFSFSKQT